MLKKESFFQYLFVQTLGYSNTKYNKLTNNNPLEKWQNNFPTSQHSQKMDSKSHGESLKPLKIKTVKSQKLLILFTNNRIANTKPNYRVNFKVHPHSALSTKSGALSHVNLYTNAKRFLTNYNRQNKKHDTSLPKGQRPPVFTIAKKAKTDPLKFSQKVFLFNKELKKDYIYSCPLGDLTTGNNLASINQISKKAVAQQKSMTRVQKSFKKDKTKEPSNNIFLTYKKSFLSYWLLPFFGLISLTGLNPTGYPSGMLVASRQQGQNPSNGAGMSIQVLPSWNLKSFVTEQRTARVYNKITEDLHSPSGYPSASDVTFKNLNLENGKTTTDQYLKWQSISNTQTIDSFYSLSFYTQKHLETERFNNSLSLATKTLRMEMLKSLFFKVFHLAFNPNISLSDLDNIGISQTEKNKLTTQINFYTLNFGFLKNSLLKQNTFDFFWYDFFLKNSMGQSASWLGSQPINSFTNSITSIPFFKNVHSQNNVSTNVTSMAFGHGHYYFPNKLLCNLALSNNATSMLAMSLFDGDEQGQNIENNQKRGLCPLGMDVTSTNTFLGQSPLLKKWQQYSSTRSLGLKLPFSQKELNSKPNSNLFLFNQVDNLQLNGTLTGITSLSKKTKNKGWNFNTAANFSAQQTKKVNLVQTKNSSKITHLNWFTIKAKYTKLLATKKFIILSDTSSYKTKNKAIVTSFKKPFFKNDHSQQLTPEKSLKKALFLLDSVWLNSVWSSSKTNTFETLWKKPFMSENYNKQSSMFSEAKPNMQLYPSGKDYIDVAWFMDNSVLFCLKQSPSWQQSYLTKANNNILKNLQALNEKIVFLLKTKNKENTQINPFVTCLKRSPSGQQSDSTFKKPILNNVTLMADGHRQKGKVISINNRNILYTCIFDALKNDLTQIITWGFDPLQKIRPVVEQKTLCSSGKDESLLVTSLLEEYREGYKATQKQTIKKLNRPMFGATLSLDTNFWAEPFMRKGYTQKSEKQQYIVNNGLCPLSINVTSPNNFNTLKNVTKLNFKISNLPFTLITENKKNQSSLLQPSSSTQNLCPPGKDVSGASPLKVSVVKNNLSSKSVNVTSMLEGDTQRGNSERIVKRSVTIQAKRDYSFVLFGNYLNSITAKIKKVFFYSKHTFLGQSPRTHLQPQTNHENSRRLSGVDITLKKLINKTTLPKIERVFLSYLSQSKLGQKNKLKLGLGTTSLEKLKQKNLTIKQKGSGYSKSMLVASRQLGRNPSNVAFNKTLIRPELIQLPLKIKNLAKNQLLLKSVKEDGSIDKNVITSFKKPIFKKRLRPWGGAPAGSKATQSAMFRKSFTVLMKNRLFVNKKQNGEYWGPFMMQQEHTPKKVLGSKNQQAANLPNNENRRKKQQIKLKRRLKKMQCATRRRKKRKIFYPRPKWLTFKMYENFLNSRFKKQIMPDNFTTTIIKNDEAPSFIIGRKAKTYHSLKNVSGVSPQKALNTKGLGTIITGKSWNMFKKPETFSKSKDFYNISATISRDLRRILMKSNWLRNYLNPYLEKIKYIYKEMEKDSKRINSFFILKDFINALYGSNFLPNVPSMSEGFTPNFSLHAKSFVTPIRDPSLPEGERQGHRLESKTLANLSDNFSEVQSFSKNYWLNMGLPTSTNTKNIYSLIDLYKLNGTILNFEYNRILYQRIQRIILNIRENLNLNGQLKNRSQKLGKNIRPFIKRDYIKRDNPLTGNQNEGSALFSKNLKKNLLNFRRNFIMLNNGYEEPSIYTTATLSPLVRNNFYWALNRTEKVLTTNPNSSYIKNLWEKYKIREINKNNKTKKMLFSLVQKYQDLLSDQTILDAFNNNLEPDFIQTNKFYQQKTSQDPFLKKSIDSERSRNNGINETWDKAPDTSSLKGQRQGQHPLFPYNFIYETSIANSYRNLIGHKVLSDNKTLLNIENLTNRNNQKTQENNLHNLKNSQVKIKRNLLATKKYIEKIEKKLINVENKLKLLGLASTKELKPSSLYKTTAIFTVLSETNPKSRISSLTRTNSFSLSAQKLFATQHRQTYKQKPEDYNTKDIIRISSLNYKKYYFRFLKQKLLKEKQFFVPYTPVTMNMSLKDKIKQTAILEGQIKNAGRKSLALQSIEPFYLEKMEKLFYAIKQQTLSEIIATQNNLSGIKLTNNIQNYNKFSSTTYWWTKVPMLQKNAIPFDSLHCNTWGFAPFLMNGNFAAAAAQQTNSNNFNLKSENLLFPLQNIDVTISLVSILFHFCALITLVSLGTVRNVIKFYYIVITKLYKVINTIRFTKILPTKATSMSFGPQQQNPTLNITLMSKGDGLRINQLQKSSMPVGQISPKGNVDGDKIKWRLEKYIRITQLLDQEKSQSLFGKKITITESMRNSHKHLLTSFKRIKLISLKYLLVRKNLANQVYMSNSNVDMDVFWDATPNIILSEGHRQARASLSLRDSSTKNSNLLLLKSKRAFTDLVNFYLQSKNSIQKRGEKLSAEHSHNNRMKINVLYDTNKNLTLGLNMIYKASFYTYLLMLKSVDVLIAPAYLIYKFFEKPGEYVVENLAYSFLLEWSADLISTIPDSIDPALANYYIKLQRNLPLYLFLNPRNINIGLIGQKTIYNLWPLDGSNNNNFVNGGLKSLVNTMESFFGIFVLSIQNSILRRFTNASLLLFTQQITEPDSDFINRQKKGIIFWDLWGESLKTIAEKNAVNIYELSTDKDEQLKLLSNMQNSNLLNKKANSLSLSGKDVTFMNPFICLNPSASNPITDSFGYIAMSNRNTNKSYFAQKFGQAMPEGYGHSQRWAVNQFLNYQGKDTELFIDMHPPRSFANTATALKSAFAIQAPIGSIVCQIFGGIFYKQISKNILVVLHNSSQTNKNLEKSLLIQAIAGETELKIITDNAHRYAMVVQGVAVGIKLLKDVFEALCATGPCIFLLEDIHAIGERRPFLIDEASPNLTESIYNKNQSMQAFLLKEKSNASREILYKTNKHLLTNYKKPYKEFKSLASNHFSFNFLYRASTNTKHRPVDITTIEVPLSIQVSQKDKENQDSNVDKKSNVDGTSSNNGFVISNANNILNKRLFSDTNSQKVNSSTKVYGSFAQLINSIKNKQSLINPPASSPFNLLLMKESTKMKPNQIVNEMAWFGLPGEQYSLISKYNYSIRIKVALLADSVLSNLSVKLEMITDLLVIIDSVKGNRGFIIFATTHLPDILDPALRRPGRFDETLSLPFIPSLYSRWTNYRYNLQYLNRCLYPSSNDVSLVKQYSIPFNSTFNKGTTLDLLKLPISYSNSQMEALFPIYNSMKSFGRMARLKTQNSLFLASSQFKKNSLTWHGDYKSSLSEDHRRNIVNFNSTSSQHGPAIDLSYLVKDYLRFSYSHSASYASKAILSLMLCLSPCLGQSSSWQQSSLTNISLYSCNNSNFNNMSTAKNRSLDSKNLEKTVKTVLKWPTMLRLGPSGLAVNDSLGQNPISPANIFENYLKYLSLFAPTYFNKTSFGQMLLLSFITYKIGETFGFSAAFKKQYSLRTLSTAQEYVFAPRAKTSFDQGLHPRKHQKAMFANKKTKNTKKTVKNPFVLNFNKNSEWKKGPSLLYSYLQKRLPQISVPATPQQQQIGQNFNYSTFYSTHLLNFNNNYSLMEPPSPPITNILLPAKRYENYRRSFKNLYNLNSHLDTVSEKLKSHQQQRLLKRLYNYPIKEFFRNEKFSWWFSQSSLKSLSETETSYSRLTEKSSFVAGQIKTQNRINFAQSYFTFAGIENFVQKNMASLNKFSSIDYSYRNILYNRHKTYLTNQWWNGQQGEHNLETTFLSDIDWRYTQLSKSHSNISSHDIQIDFPDCDQFYNPRNRRWILTTGDWNFWFSLEADLNNIYSHYIYESFTKAYKTIDHNREILDFYSAKLLRNSFNLLNLVESLDAKKFDVAIISTAENQKNKNVSSSFTTGDIQLMSVKSIAESSKRTSSKINVNIASADLTHREILNLYKRFFDSSI